MNIAVIFAGGVGSRMHTKELPKQFLEVHGKPIIVRTAEAFDRHSDVDAIVVACIGEWIQYCSDKLFDAGLSKVVDIVPGGKTGQLSIYNGLVASAKHAGNREATVLIHDGVRPLVDATTISRCIEAVNEYGSAIACVPAKETVLTVAPNTATVIQVVDRNACVLARAPQCFPLRELLSAHEWALANGKIDYIDSATLMMARGYNLHVIQGQSENIKVTTHDDYYALQAALNARENLQLTEMGYEY